jgi:hypothetical protein
MLPDSWDRTFRLRLAVLTLLVGVAAVAATRLPTVQSEAQAAGVAPTQLALTLGEWQGVDQPVPSDVQQALPSARILSRRYQCPAGAADVTIIAGSDATALHDPHDCLTGEGWQFVTEQTRTVDVAQDSMRGSRRSTLNAEGQRSTLDARRSTRMRTPQPSLPGPSVERRASSVVLQRRASSVEHQASAPAGPIQIRDVVMVKGAVRARMWYWYAIGPEIYDRTLPARMALYRTRLAHERRHRAEFVRLIVGGETESVRTTTLLTDLTRQIAARS